MCWAAPRAAAAEHPLAQVGQAAVNVAHAREDVLTRTDRPRLYLQSSVFARGTGANPDGSFDGGADGLGLERTNWAAGVQVVFPNLFDFAGLRARRAAAGALTRVESARYDETILTITGQQRVAGRLVDGHGLAGQRGLVQAGAAAEQPAVQRHPLARRHAHPRADRHLRRRDGGPASVLALDLRGLRRQLRQRADRIAGAGQAEALHHLGQAEQPHHHRRLGPLAEHDGADHRQAHQQVDVERHALERDPALAQRRQAAEQHGRHRQRDHQRTGFIEAGEGQRLRRDRGHARQRHAPAQAGRDRRRRCGWRGGSVDGLGAHPGGRDRGAQRGVVGQAVMDIEQPVDQVELQGDHAVLALQLLAQQAFLGRAIHAGDEVALPRRPGQGLGRDPRRALDGHVAVVVVMPVLIAVVVAVAMRVRGSVTVSVTAVLTELAGGRGRRRVTAAAAAGSRRGLGRGGTVIVFLMCHGGGLDSL